MSLTVKTMLLCLHQVSTRKAINTVSFVKQETAWKKSRYDSLTSPIITSPGCWHQGAPALSPAPASSASKISTGKSAEIQACSSCPCVFSNFFCLSEVDSAKFILFITTTHSKIYGNFQAHVGCPTGQVRPGPARLVASCCIYHSALQGVTAEEI